MTEYNIKVRGAENLQLGDVVRCFEDAYGTATVCKITESVVYAFRPFVHVSDFSYGSDPQVIPYVGHEMCSWFKTDPTEFHVYRRQPIK